jgi:hypothetical protein
MRNRPLWAVAGFLLFALGILSLILSLVGLRFSFFSFMDGHSIWSVLFQLLLLFGGMGILYVARTTDSEEKGE